MNNKNKTKKWVNHEWVECNYNDLIVGDVFRMYKGNGHSCKNKYGGVAFLAMSNCQIKHYSKEERLRDGHNYISSKFVETWTKDKHGLEVLKSMMK